MGVFAELALDYAMNLVKYSLAIIMVQCNQKSKMSVRLRESE